MKRKDPDESQSPTELLSQLQALVLEVETIMAGTGGEQTAEVISGLRKRLAAAQGTITELYEDAKDKVVAGAQRTDEAIRENPYQSMAIALGVGVLLGVLVGRRRR